MSASPKLFERLHEELRCRHYSYETEVQTTMIYIPVLNRGGKGVRSPLNI
jgi:hypothetical protein